MTRTIAYTSPFVPPEWIAAHGLLPHRLVLNRATSPINAGVCPFAAAFADHVCHATPDEAFVLTTTCDQMRRIAEHLAADASRVFSFNVPATWQPDSSMQLYIAELHRLSRFLCRLGGSAPQPARLAAIMKEHDARRHPSHDPAGIDNTTRIPLALVGGALRKQDQWLFDSITHAGGHVALDATETGHRALPAPFNPLALEENPLPELARAYFGSIPDAFRRPDTLLHDYLRQQLESHAIRGIILVRYLWCDLWHAQSARLKETTRLPVAEVDLGDQDHDLQRTRTRIESLINILQ